MTTPHPSCHRPTGHRPDEDDALANPLVRTSDRVEALVVVLAVVITRVTATVTSLKVAYHESLGPTITVLARWFDAGTEHTGAVSAPPGVKSGDSIDIWVGQDGSHVGPPHKTAYDEAVAVASAFWLSVAVAAGVLVAGTLAARNRARFARWQDDFDNRTGDGDWHTSQP